MARRPYKTTLEIRHEAQNISSACSTVNPIIDAINRKNGVYVQQAHTEGVALDEKADHRAVTV